MTFWPLLCYIYIRMKFKNQKGQAVLIVLLSLSVVLIVVMFVVSRSITDISLSTKEENSLRAFSAAEAGIERALVIGSAQNFCYWLCCGIFYGCLPY